MMLRYFRVRGVVAAAFVVVASGFLVLYSIEDRLARWLATPGPPSRSPATGFGDVVPPRGNREPFPRSGGVRVDSRSKLRASRSAGEVEGTLRDLLSEHSGVLRAGASEEVSRELLARHGAEALSDLAEHHLRMPRELIPNESEELEQLLARWIEVLAGSGEAIETEAAIEPDPPVVGRLAFSSWVDSNRRIRSTGGRFPVGERRIHAVYENDQIARPLRHVLAIWRDLDLDRVLYQRVEPVTPSAGTSYVWLESEQGWEPGRYSVELCDPGNRLEIVAEGTFQIDEEQKNEDLCD